MHRKRVELASVAVAWEEKQCRAGLWLEGQHGTLVARLVKHRVTSSSHVVEIHQYSANPVATERLASQRITRWERIVVRDVFLTCQVARDGGSLHVPYRLLRQYAYQFVDIVAPLV